MVLTDTGTDKVYGKITNVQIGKDSSNGVDITSGVLSFEFWRNHDATRADNANSKTASEIFQPHSSYGWKLRFASDCRVAFFATDVGAAGGNQYALDPNGDSNEIEYFKVILKIVNSAGTDKTRTFTLDDAFCTKNRAYMGDDQLTIFEYEGDAEEITYADA